MNKFDKKIKKLTKDIEVPESYNEKVDKLLLDILKKEVIPEKKQKSRLTFRLAICLLCIFCALSLYTIDAQANIFDFFKETIMDFLGRGSSDEDRAQIGVDSEKLAVESKPDLIMELQEAVMDSHSIYLLVQISAPANISFDQDILFDYFCFCKGTNYNVDHLIGGAISCELLETSEALPNVATYVVSLIFEETLEEGVEVTACFRDLTKDPYSANPELLVGGVWSIPFFYYPTVTDKIKIEGTSDMIFDYINTTAELKSIELTPFGIVLVADVSNFPSDELGISDTTIAMRLKMIDGSELTVVSHNPEQRGYMQGRSVSHTEKDSRTYQRDTLEFLNMVNISKVTGIYIEDLWIPLK